MPATPFRSSTSKSQPRVPSGTRYRILIPTVTAGGGHLQAAAALEEAWAIERSQDVVKRVDVLDFMPALMRKSYAQGYVKLVERAPELYGHFFRTTDDAALVARLNEVRRWSARWVTRRFLKFLEDFR